MCCGFHSSTSCRRVICPTEQRIVRFAHLIDEGVKVARGVDPNREEAYGICSEVMQVCASGRPRSVRLPHMMEMPL